MNKIIITTNTTDIIGLKESAAMMVEHYGDIISMEVQDVCTQLEIEPGARR